MQRRTIVVLVLALLAPVDASPGTEAGTLEAGAAAIEQAAAQPDGERVVVGHISRKLAVPVDTLRAQRRQTELAWGDLLIANHLAALTGLTFEQIAAEFRVMIRLHAAIRGRHRAVRAMEQMGAIVANKPAAPGSPTRDGGPGSLAPTARSVHGPTLRI